MIENYTQYQATKQQLANFIAHGKLTETAAILRQEIQEYDERVRQMVYDAYNLLAGRFIEGHLQGIALLEKARRLCPEIVNDVSTETEEGSYGSEE